MCRNPATIADNVGDNVGDVAGMGADLFGSYVATILATMVLGREIIVNDNFNGLSPMLLPMLIAGLGIIFSIIGFSLVRISDDKGNVQKALNHRQLDFSDYYDNRLLLYRDVDDSRQI